MHIFTHDVFLVQISDFGLSRSISVPIRAYSETVVTQWYRAPELLLGGLYAYPLDIWALGNAFHSNVNMS